MSVTKCSNGKFKIGLGSCMYETQEQAEKVLFTMQSVLSPKTELEIEPNPCWEGYEPIGLKEDGSPNCVPITLSKVELTEFQEGVPHYTADRKLWKGDTHKDSTGRLMTGKVHTEDSQYLYHKESLKY